MENFLEDLVQEQANHGHRVWVLCHWHETGQSTRTDELPPGLNLTRTEIKGIPAYAPLAPGFYQELRKIINSFSPDIVHVHMPNLSAFFLLLFKTLPKIVVHWHSDVVASDHDFRLKLLYPGYRIFEKRLLEKAEIVICTSGAYLNSSTPLAMVKKKCRVIPLGISQAKMKKFDSKSTNYEDHPGKHFFLKRTVVGQRDFILAVGRFSYYKGFEHLIRACAQGFGGYVVIVGDGPLRPVLNRLIDKLCLKQKIVLPGMLPDHYLYQLLSACTSLCLPSIERTEAFGLVLLEAMYYAKPLITTKVAGSGMNEVNIHNVTGLVVQPENPRDLAKAMDYMVHNKEHAQTMGMKGRQRFLKYFVISSVAEQIERLYQKHIPSAK